MESSPLSRHFDLRLKEINQQIHSALKDVRKHLHELEQAAQQPPVAGPPKDFAQLLKESLQQRTPPTGQDK